MHDDDETRRVQAARPRRPSRAALVLCLLLAGAAGCEQERSSASTKKNAPWRIDEGSAVDESLPRTTYRTSPGQKLEFSVPAKYATPRGVLEGVTGSVEFHPARLAQVRGQIEVELGRVRMLESSEEELQRLAKRQGKHAEDARRTLLALERQGTWTEQARRWLGVPAQGFPGKAREAESRARFTLEFAKDLSYPRASLGARSKPDDRVGEMRIVHAAVQGKLQLRGYSVERSFPVRLAFHYPGAAKPGDLPDALEVSFRGQFAVPLSEYDIRPRDEQGVVVATLEERITRLVGTVARISGSLRFQRVSGSRK